MHGLYNAWLDIRNDHRVVEIRPSQVGRKTENLRVHFCQSAKNDLQVKERGLTRDPKDYENLRCTNYRYTTELPTVERYLTWLLEIETRYNR